MKISQIQTRPIYQAVPQGHQLYLNCYVLPNKVITVLLLLLLVKVKFPPYKETIKTKSFGPT